MAYTKSTLIMRSRPGLSGFLDDLKNLATGAVDFYGQAKKNQGAADALSQQQVAAQAVPVSSGIDPTTLLMIGALGIGAIILLKKKKSS